MFKNVEIFRMSHAMAVHAGEKQALVAQNVANADTPGYVARDLPAFNTLYQSADAGVQRATRARHFNGAIAGSSTGAAIDRKSGASPDGNSVSIEGEMLNAVAAVRQHDRALAIYKSALNVLHSTLARA